MTYADLYSLEKRIYLEHKPSIAEMFQLVRKVSLEPQEEDIRKVYWKVISDFKNI